MAKQTINQGTTPNGAGGDTFRSGSAKLQANDDELYAALGASGGVLPLALPIGKGGTGATTAAQARVNLDLDKFVQNHGLNTAMVAPEVDAAIIITNTGWGVYSGNVPGFSRALKIGDGGTGAETVEQARINLGLDRFVQQGDLNTFVSSPNKDLLINLENHNISLYRISTSTSYTVRTGLNTLVDGNGFIKSASPVVQLFADKVAANEEALDQGPLFEKVDIGHYLLKNTEGFSGNGWYIEMPKDANGNVLVAVQYQQLEDNTIEVKTFAKKFDEETGDIVPNLEKPRDIPVGRWIDIRLKELPKPDIEISNTPPEFQPTNLAQAVAEALKNGAEQ